MQPNVKSQYHARFFGMYLWGIIQTFPPPPKKKHPDQKNKCPIYPPIFPTTKNETQGLSNLSDNLPAFLCRTSSRGFISWWMVLHGAVPPAAVFGKCGNFNKTRVVVTMLLMEYPHYLKGVNEMFNESILGNSKYISPPILLMVQKSGEKSTWDGNKTL